MVIFQEQIDRESIAVTVKASKLTAQVLAKALKSVADKIRENHNKQKPPPCGKQTVKQLMKHNVSTNTIPIEGDTKLFEQVARKWNVDYAFHKTDKNKFLLLFKSGQADAITAAFSEYSKIVMKRAKDKRPLVKEAYKKAAERAERQKPKQKERKREREAARE